MTTSNQDRFVFRLWDKSTNTMHYDANDGIRIYLNGCVSIKDTWLKPEEFILMQSTGLKDRTGKLIFDGDILEHAKGVFYKVTWNRDGLWLVESEENSDILWRWAKVSKIAGNIYQHKNLLK